MTNKRKSQLRGRVKKKQERECKVDDDQNSLSDTPTDVQTQFPGLRRGCRVTLQNIKVERGETSDVLVSKAEVEIEKEEDEAKHGIKRKHAKDYYADLLKLKMSKKTEKESTLTSTKKQRGKTKSTNIVKPGSASKENSDKIEMKTNITDDSKTTRSKEAVSKGIEAVDNPKSKNTSIKGKKGETKSKKTEHIFIDFELSKSRRISEINILLRGTGTSKQFSSLPPNSLARAFLQYLGSQCSHLNLTAVFLCARSACLFMELVGRMGQEHSQVFQTWTDLNTLIRRQLDPEDLKGVQLEANRLEMLFSQVSNSDIKAGTVPRTSRMREIFEYKSLYMATSPQQWIVPHGKYLLAVSEVGLLKNENPVVRQVGRLSLSLPSLEWEEGVVPPPGQMPTVGQDLGLTLLKPSNTWCLEGAGRESKPCVSPKEAVLGLLQRLEEEVKVSKSEGVLLVTVWDSCLSSLLSLVATHGLVSRLRRVLAGVTSLQEIWGKQRGRELLLEDLGQGDPCCSLASAGRSVLETVLGESPDPASHCRPLSSPGVNTLLCEAVERGMVEFSEAVSSAVLVTSLSLEAGRMGVAQLSVRPELRGHSTSQYDLSPLATKHSGTLTLANTVQSSSGQGRMSIRVTNISSSRVRLGVGSVLGLVRRIEDMDTELENERLRGSRSPGSCSEVDDEEKEQGEKDIGEKEKDKREESTPSRKARKRKLDGDDSDVMISLDLLRETLTKELQARVVDEVKEKSSVSKDDGAAVPLKPEDKIEIKGCEDVFKENSDSSDLNQFLDLEETFRNKDILPDLNELQPSDLEISNWEDLNSALEGIDMTSAFDIVDFSENPLSTMDSVVESIGSSRNTERPDLENPVQSSSDSVSTLTKSQISNEYSDPVQQVFRQRPYAPLSPSAPLVVQLASIMQQVSPLVIEVDELEEQFPCLLGQAIFSPLLLTMVTYSARPLDQLPFTLTDFGDKLVSELQSLQLDSLEDLKEFVKKIHNENPEASLDVWKEKFSTKFEHFQGINEMVGEHFDLKTIQLIVLHFVDHLGVFGLADTNVKDMIAFGDCFDNEEEGDRDHVEIVKEDVEIQIVKEKSEVQILGSSPPPKKPAGTVQDEIHLTHEDMKIIPTHEVTKIDLTHEDSKIEHDLHANDDTLSPSNNEALKEGSQFNLDKLPDTENTNQEGTKTGKSLKVTDIGLCPLDPNRDISSIYLGVRDEFLGPLCKVMALQGEDPFYATFSCKELVLHGKRQENGYSVREALAENGQDDDLILVQVPALLPMSETQEFHLCAVAVPLSSWADGRFFYEGFVLYHGPQEEALVAFLQGDLLRTATVTRDRIKKFDPVLDMKCLEPGLEVKLMVQHSEDKHSVSLCIPNPEKTFYDLLDISTWGTKTQRHLTDSETQADITDSFRRQVTIQTVYETERQFLLIRASNKNLASQASKLVLDTKKTFEKLPGMKPRVNSKIEVFMESLPESLQATEKALEELVHVSHYTGTNVSLVDGEVLVEGRDQARVLLARDILRHNIGLAVQSPVLGTSDPGQKKTSNVAGATKIELRASSNSEVLVELDDAEVSSTTGSSDPQPGVSLGMEVGEGCVVDIQEIPTEAEQSKLDSLKPTLSKNTLITELPKVKEVTKPDEANKKETQSSQSRNEFNVVLEKCITIKAKSVAFADAVVENADERIFDLVHEIKRHPEFTNLKVFVPERQKKKISVAGKLKISIRNKTEESLDLDNRAIICKITLKMHDEPKKQVSPEMLQQVPVLKKTGKNQTPSTSSKIEVIDLEDESDEAVVVLKKVEQHKKVVEVEQCIDARLVSPTNKTVKKTRKAVPKHKEKPKDPEPLKTPEPIKTPEPLKTPVSPSTKSSSQEPPACSHPPLAPTACPEALISMGKCLKSHCPTSLQHTFPDKLLEGMQQEFCLRHLRNKVCTRALPPFLCTSRQHVESTEPLLAFYRAQRSSVLIHCKNCKDELKKENVDEHIIPKSKDVASVLELENLKSALTKELDRDIVDSKLATQDPDKSQTAETPFKDHCSHIKFRMTLCEFRDKCPKSGCALVHAINEVLKIEFCPKFLTEPALCQASKCLPHYSLSQLQEKYHLAVRSRVLNCSKCIFRCKHFNAANLPNKQALLCAPDLAGNCPHVTNGKILCKSVHREEVQHLTLPKSNSEYKAKFKPNLNASKGHCKICKAEMVLLKNDFERYTRQSNNTTDTMVQGNSNSNSSNITSVVPQPPKHIVPQIGPEPVVAKQVSSMPRASKSAQPTHNATSPGSKMASTLPAVSKPPPVQQSVSTSTPELPAVLSLGQSLPLVSTPILAPPPILKHSPKKPAVIKPTTVNPAVSQPAPAPPAASKPTPVILLNSKPNVSQATAVLPDAPKPFPVQPAAPKPAPAHLALSKPGPTQSSLSRSGPTKALGSSPGPTHPGVFRASPPTQMFPRQGVPPGRGVQPPRGVCRNMWIHGSCRFGNQCKFKH